MRITTLLLVGLAFVLGGCRTRLPIGVLTPVGWKDAATDATIENYPWPDYVTGEEKQKIEDALTTIFDLGGRDARDAEVWLVELDREADAYSLRVAGRLVSEMKTVMDKHTLDGYEGKSRVMVLDRMLRKLDGVQERLLGFEYGVDIDDNADRVTRIIRGWNWWYQKGRYLQRYDPWDWSVDGEDEGEYEEEAEEEEEEDR